MDGLHVWFNTHWQHWSGCFLWSGEDQPCWCWWSDNHAIIPSLSHTPLHIYATATNSPVHDEVLSPFSMEDQISPDQLRKTKEEKQVKKKERKRKEGVTAWDLRIQRLYNTVRWGVNKTVGFWPLKMYFWPRVWTHSWSLTASFPPWRSCWWNEYDEEQRLETIRREKDTNTESNSCTCYNSLKKTKSLCYFLYVGYDDTAKQPAALRNQTTKQNIKTKWQKKTNSPVMIEDNISPRVPYSKVMTYILI